MISYSYDFIMCYAQFDIMTNIFFAKNIQNAFDEFVYVFKDKIRVYEILNIIHNQKNPFEYFNESETIHINQGINILNQNASSYELRKEQQAYFTNILNLVNQNNFKELFDNDIDIRIKFLMLTMALKFNNEHNHNNDSHHLPLIKIIDIGIKKIIN